MVKFFCTCLLLFTLAPAQGKSLLTMLANGEFFKMAFVPSQKRLYATGEVFFQDIEDAQQRKKRMVFFKNTKVFAELVFLSNGDIEGKSFCANGNMHYEFYVVNEKVHGLVKEYRCSNASLKTKTSFVENIAQGKGKMYDIGGHLRFEYRIQDGFIKDGFFYKTKDEKIPMTDSHFIELDQYL